MEISVRSLLEIFFIVLILKLIVVRWQPPLQQSMQAIICISLGTILGFGFYPSREGLITAILASGIAFYGGDIFSEFRSIKDDIKNEVNDEDIRALLKSKDKLK